MGVSTVERQITEIEQTRPAALPAIDWDEVNRLGIGTQAPEMTNWKAIQKYIGVRRGLIRWVDGVLRNQRESGIDSFDPTYSNLLDKRRELSTAQRFDRLVIAGKR